MGVYHSSVLKVEKPLISYCRCDEIMTDDTKHIILDNKYARIIKELSGMYNIGMDEAADIFYNSELLPLIENGVADLHCRSDKYLACEIWREYKEAAQA